MVDFRKGIILLAVLALFTGLASAQVNGGPGQGQLTCSTGVTVTPQLRNEGYTEQTGDITITCTGGQQPTTANVAIPLVNITIFYNTTVTSRLFATGSTNIPNEALLLIDEPGATGLTGDGPGRPQKLCATPFSGCPAFTNFDGRGAIYAGVDGTSACSTSTGVGTCSNIAPNVYQGVAASTTGNAVTFFGVPVLAPTTTGSRVYRVTNVRVNAVPLANQASVIASISISPASSLGITNATLAVGFVGTSLSTDRGTRTLQQCASLTRSSSGSLTFTELFASAFKTRIQANGNGSYSGQGVPGSTQSPANQNVPGTIYNSESNFVFAASGTNGLAGGTAGLADFGTRLKATFNNIPTGVRIFVSTQNIINGAITAVAPIPVGGTSISSYAKLINGETTSDGTLALTDSSSLFLNTADVTTNSGTVPLFEVSIDSTRSGSAVWEVVNTNPNSNETFSFGYYVSVSANASANTPLPGISTINLSYAPTATSGAASSSLAIPRFQGDQAAARNLLTVIVCRTVLLFPYLVNQIGLDTGIAIANTSQDPFAGTATASQSGTCTMTFYPSDPAATAPPVGLLQVAGGTSTTIKGGNSGVGLLSSFAPGFQGYMFAVCNFQWAHGFAFISDVGLRNLAMGYLAVVIDDPGTGSRFQRNTQTTENGGH